LKLTEIVKQIVIDPRKLTHYALNPTHPDGKDKAFVFATVLGITQENYEILLHQLDQKAGQTEVTIHKVIDQGTLYTANILIEGVTGRQVTVVTGWLVQAYTARLVTLRIKKR